MNQSDADQLRQWVAEMDLSTLWLLIVWLIREWAYRHERRLAAKSAAARP